VTIVRKVLVGLLLLSGIAGGTGCHELNKFERWKNEKLFGRPSCFPGHGASDDECCEDEMEYDGSAPGFIGEEPVYVQ
jgi:hypothetical protein